MNPKNHAIIKRAGLACVLALILVAIVHQLGLAIDDTDLAVRSPDSQGYQSVTLTMALVATAVASAASLALALVLRRWAKARRNWLTVAICAASLSILSPILTAQRASGATWLVLLHLTVAAALIPTVAPALGSEPRSERRPPEPVHRAN